MQTFGLRQIFLLSDFLFCFIFIIPVSFLCFFFRISFFCLNFYFFKIILLFLFLLLFYYHFFSTILFSVYFSPSHTQIAFYLLFLKIDSSWCFEPFQMFFSPFIGFFLLDIQYSYLKKKPQLGSKHKHQKHKPNDVLLKKKINFLNSLTSYFELVSYGKNIHNKKAKWRKKSPYLKPFKLIS